MNKIESISVISIEPSPLLMSKEDKMKYKEYKKAREKKMFMQTMAINRMKHARAAMDEKTGRTLYGEPVEKIQILI